MTEPIFSISQSSISKRHLHLALKIPNARSTFLQLDNNDLLNFSTDWEKLTENLYDQIYVIN